MDEEKREEEPGSERVEERPLECVECKKPIAVRYSEIVGNRITHTIMCKECPQLEKRLHGIPFQGKTEAAVEARAGLCCGTCGTTLESVRTGGVLGCSGCYEVFEDVLLRELQSTQKIPPKRASQNRSAPLHIGRLPGESKEMNPSLRLLALNEALDETLQREDYEQAAWLRDQIKEITEKNGGEEK